MLKISGLPYFATASFKADRPHCGQLATRTGIAQIIDQNAQLFRPVIISIRRVYERRNVCVHLRHRACDHKRGGPTRRTIGRKRAVGCSDRDAHLAHALGRIHVRYTDSTDSKRAVFSHRDRACPRLDLLNGWSRAKSNALPGDKEVAVLRKAQCRLAAETHIDRVAHLGADRVELLDVDARIACVAILRREDFGLVLTVKGHAEPFRYLNR